MADATHTAMRRQFRCIVAVLLLAGAAMGGAPVPAAAQGTGPAWQLIQPPQATLVLARDGSLIGEIGRQLRTSVALSTLPKYVGEAFIAVEDRRFYEHNGVDLVGIAGAIKDALGGHVRGASTITQQLVGNMHPDEVNRADMSIARKLREQEAAREMEQHYDKAQILEAYLNQISFGHGWFGVDEAARHYFGIPAARLSLVQAATLAALPKGPAIYDPIGHPARARERRNIVLALMAQQHYITHAAAVSAERQPVVTVPDRGMPAAAPYLVDVVREQAERAGIPVENGGFRIITTIDPALQRDATRALDSGLVRIESQPGYHHPTLAHHPKGSTAFLEGAVVALDPHTGDVLSLVGGRNYLASPFDRAMNAVRQPGSAFKPIVYADALSRRMPPNAIVPDTALAIPLANGTLYQPTNDDNRFLGPITLRTALVESRNTVAVQLGQTVGMDSIAALAQRLGITSPIAPFPSSAIGASAVRPIDLVAAYSAFDDLGAVAAPRFIARIEDRAGRTVYAPPVRAPAFVIDPRVAFIVRDMMRDVVARGTGRTVGRYVPANLPVAGKTGTTNGASDLWFVGMTPDIVAGVWVGFDRPTPVARNAVGGTYAGPIWGSMVARYYADHPVDSTAWDAPPAGMATAELDRATGALATAATPPDSSYTEYFLAGTQPGALESDPWALFAEGPVGW